jgi:hypothetical protein
MRSGAGRASWLGWAAAGAGAATVLALLAWQGPATGGVHAPCPSRRLLDLPCAGCGMTRALAALARGSWAEAVAWHPLSVVYAIEAALVWLGWAARNAGLLRAPSPAVVTAWLALNAAALVLVWLSRLVLGTLPT